jgi:3-oxoacyl-[acyl-carrier protein] reductase
VPQNGRVALLTGAAGGIGHETALLLASSGYRVGLLDREGDKLDQLNRECADLPGGAIALPCDLRDPDQCRRSVDRLQAAFGAPDILINNAAAYPIGPWARVSLDEWNEVLAVNLSAAFLLSQLVADHMAQQGWGRIVNISSVTLHVGLRDRPHYIASKGGLVGLTRALARELGQRAITVNAVAPGAIQTQGEHSLLGTDQRRREWDAFVFERQCLPRRGVPKDVASVILFLVSDAASFVTGQELLVDGGWAFD